MLKMGETMSKSLKTRNGDVINATNQPSFLKSAKTFPAGGAHTDVGEAHESRGSFAQSLELGPSYHRHHTVCVERLTIILIVNYCFFNAFFYCTFSWIKYRENSK